MCELGHFEPCTIWDERTHKARKPHVCSCCKRAIAAGETYTAHFSVYEGEAAYERLCAECDKDRDEFGRAHAGYPMPSDFARSLSECISEGDEESERRWRPMLDRIRATRRKQT